MAKSMYNVLGIALVMEEVGRGAKLVLRYPSKNLQETLLSHHLSPGGTEVACSKKRRSRVTHEGADVSSTGEADRGGERTQERLNENDQNDRSSGTNNSDSIRGTTGGISFGVNSSGEERDNHSGITSHFRHMNTPGNGTNGDASESRLSTEQRKHDIQPRLSSPTASSLAQSENDGTTNRLFSPSSLSRSNTGGSSSSKGMVNQSSASDKNNTNDSGGNNNYRERSKSDDNDDNLFFELPSRVLSKLFRPKAPLCDQPMTLIIGSTVFCCRAVLVNEIDDDDGGGIGGIGDGQHPQGRAVLFSVIVALAPHPKRGRSISSARHGMSPTGREELPKHRQKEDPPQPKQHSETPHPGAPSNVAVRRTHRSLTRLCRVLHREETRCRYVSIQSANFLRLREEKLRGRRATENASEDDDGGDAVMEEQLLELMLAYQDKPQHPIEALHHGNLARDLVSSYHSLALLNRVPGSQCDWDSQNHHLAAADHGVVSINDHLAVPIDPVGIELSHASQNEIPPNQGMIVQPYHTLLFPHKSTKERLLNDHNPASPTAAFKGSADNVKNFENGNSHNQNYDYPSQPLHKLLQTTQPFQQLIDTSTESTLPLHCVLNLASNLVKNGMCITCPVFSRNTRFACADDGIVKMRDLRLEFAVRFQVATIRQMAVFEWASVDGTVPGAKGRPPRCQLDLFTVVAVLTRNGTTLGSVLVDCCTNADGLPGTRIDSSQMMQHDDAGDDAPVSSYVDSIVSKPVFAEPSPSTGRTKDGVGAKGQKAQEQQRSAAPSAFNLGVTPDDLCEMALWLRAHGIIVELLDYPISIIKLPATDTTFVSDNHIHKSDIHSYLQLEQQRQQQHHPQQHCHHYKYNHHVSKMNTPDAMLRLLFKDLLESNCLNGRVSNQAICYKHGISQRTLLRFISWGISSGRLEIITRIATPGDDIP